MTTHWSLHACYHDPECRSHGAPPRVYVGTPWGILIVAMTWNARTQAWVPWRGYVDSWWPVVWHPR